jgi:hypothetical protein
MPRQKLTETLSRLHEELAAEPALNDETAALLRAILADIEKLLAADQDEAAGAKTGAKPENETLVSRLADATADFENSHPRLTATVGQLADALSGMGI